MIASKERLCLALDVDNQEEALRLVGQLSDSIGYFKVGLQLFISEGPQIIDAIKNLKGKIFLDLKLPDIPNTVAQASRRITNRGISMFNLHASGGKEMMQAAAQASREEAERQAIPAPKILAVTLLTSIDQSALKDDLKVDLPIQDYVVHLARLAQESGLDGVIASPQEISAIRQACGDDFLIVTPGIRSSDSPPDDQKRTLSPTEAIRMGADCLVVGRPIRAAQNPIEAADAILKEITAAINE